MQVVRRVLPDELRGLLRRLNPRPERHDTVVPDWVYRTRVPKVRSPVTADDQPRVRRS